jgi:hypothetical protein
MIELINTAAQTVQPLQAVVYNEVVYRSRRCAEGYRGDGGLVKLTEPGIYRVTFNGNIAEPSCWTPMR